MGIEKKPEAWVFKQLVQSGLYASICGSCGFTELYATNPRAIYDAYLAAQREQRVAISFRLHLIRRNLRTARWRGEQFEAARSSHTREAAMRKVKLVVEHLAVESFETSKAHGQGTVFGRMPEMIVNPGAAAADTYPECPSPLCQDTPLASCDGSCQPGCVTPNETVVVTG